MTDPQGPDKPRPASAASGAQAWGIAMNFVYGVIGLGLIGWAVQWFWPRTAPWPILVGLLLGLVGGMVRFIYDAQRIGSGRK